MIYELNEAQNAEFDTPLLKIFAKSFINFQHSSPCTSKRKLYRYFEPLDTKQIPEKDILFGEDREKTYKILIADFKACLMAHEFDKFFENKTYYWESKTIPNLIILKKWLSSAI